MIFKNSVSITGQYMVLIQNFPTNCSVEDRRIRFISIFPKDLIHFPVLLRVIIMRNISLLRVLLKNTVPAKGTLLRNIVPAKGVILKNICPD